MINFEEIFNELGLPTETVVCEDGFIMTFGGDTKDSISMAQSIVDDKVEELRRMDSFVRDDIGDEDIIDYWLTYGLPDDYDDDDLVSIAEDDEQYNDIVNAFDTCVELYEGGDY